MKCPCKGCNERYSACHDDCDKYKAWSSWLQTGKDNRQQERDVTDAIIRGKLRVKRLKGL